MGGTNESERLLVVVLAVTLPVMAWLVIRAIVRARKRAPLPALQAAASEREAVAPLGLADLASAEARAEELEARDSFQSAIDLRLEIIRLKPLDRASYERLYSAVLGLKRFDHAWCVAAALCYLGAKPESEERQFFQDYLTGGLRIAPAKLDAAGWAAMQVRDPRLEQLSAFFELLSPLAARVARQRLVADKALPALRDRERADAATGDAATAARTIGWAFRLLGLEPPQLFIEVDSDRAPALVPSEPVSCIAGVRHFSERSQSESFFEIARLACLTRKENALRAWVTTSAELSVLHHAALRVFADAKEAPADEPRVAETAKMLARLVQRAERARLQVAARTLPATSASDLDRWLELVDESADRVGLLLSANLEAIASQIGVVDDSQRRIEQLLLFSVSPTYVALRAQLGLDILIDD